MSRYPFKPTKDQSTEFGFGEGMFPDPNIDFSDNGFKSGIPIADPDQDKQLLMLMAGRRTDLHNPAVPDMPPSGAGGHPDFYTLGNTDRYGASPPLVRCRIKPRTKPVQPEAPRYMERKW